MVARDFGLDDGAAHRRVGQPVGGDAERDQPGAGGDETVGVPVGQQPASFDSVIVQHGVLFEGQMPGQEGQEGVRPAHGTVDPGHVAGAEELHNLLVADVEGQMRQAG